MRAVRNSFTVMRSAWVTVLALMLAMHIVTSAGYMPMVEHGRLSVMLCPDGEWTAPSMPMGGSHHGSNPASHQLCPYAAAAAMPFAGAPPLLLLTVASAAFALFAPVLRQSPPRPGHLARPPSTGPPLPA